MKLQIKGRIMDEKYLNINQVADFLGVSVATIRKYRSEKSIPFHKVNGLLRFKKSEIDEWINRMEAEPIKVKKSIPKGKKTIPHKTKKQADKKKMITNIPVARGVVVSGIRVWGEKEEEELRKLGFSLTGMNLLDSSRFKSISG